MSKAQGHRSFIVSAIMTKLDDLNKSKGGVDIVCVSNPHSKRSELNLLRSGIEIKARWRYHTRSCSIGIMKAIIERLAQAKDFRSWTLAS